MLLIAPLIPAPPNGVAAKFDWEVFYAWDSGWYEQIATKDYYYSDNNKLYSVAFFPLFPLVTRVFMTFGLPFEIAGTLVNNLAFLAALVVLYLWVEERYSTSAARWATAVLAWCPYSVYGTVIYTEGLFLLCSTSALRAFDKKEYTWVALWGSLATATRITGVALISAFLFASWKQHRGVKAFIASLVASGGLLLYSLYCQIKFGDFLAFLNAQKGWRSSYGFNWGGWWKVLMQIVVGSVNVRHGSIKDFSYPLLFAIVLGVGYVLWRFRSQLGSTKVRYGFCFLLLVVWIMAGDAFLKTVMIFGGLSLLWLSRKKLPLAAFVYGLCSYAMIFNTGLVASVDRYAYAIVTLSFAFGLLLARYPRLGYLIIGFFAIPLVTFAVRFSQNLWLA
ncbi:hypothetical protein [Scytonema sp. NUACC26]|uniref:hypothetical protein n=1 Tax=Scytonema sp. NUACC26 TaxID=3140176 RepID=UPI0038B238C1